MEDDELSTVSIYNIGLLNTEDIKRPATGKCVEAV